MDAATGIPALCTNAENIADTSHFRNGAAGYFADGQRIFPGHVGGKFSG